MLPEASFVSLRSILLTLSDDERLWGVLDGASIEAFPAMIERHRIPAICLLPGELSPEMAEVAPYLVPLDTFPAFLDEALAEGWGRHGGIFVHSAADQRALRQHFRSLMTVYDPEGRPLFFRFYDPRVLRVYLPTCNASELETFFGPVRRYWLEDEAAERLRRYDLEEGGLIARTVELSKSYG